MNTIQMEERIIEVGTSKEIERIKKEKKRERWKIGNSVGMKKRR